MPRKWWQGWQARAAILLCLPTSLALVGPAVADVAWTERAGAWSVTLYLGERGDSWCGWTTTWTDPADGLGRSVSFQMRGDESVLFLFVEGAVMGGLSAGSELTLGIDQTRGIVEVDLVRQLPNGFLMARGVLAADAADRDRLIALLSQASSVELILPGGSAWPLEATGLAQTGLALRRCLADMEARQPPR
jgi:hypothetical protein